jgi:hypothetical protein
MGDEPDYVSLAADAEEKAGSAEALHQAAFWRERAENYREFAIYLRQRNEAAPSTHGT